MKRILAIFAIIALSISLAFASNPNDEKRLNIGADIGILSQGISVRYVQNRWCEVESSLRLPISAYIYSAIDSSSDTTYTFDPYVILSPELSATYYFSPVKSGPFRLALGINGSISVNTNGPSIENPGTESETHHSAGALLLLGLKPAIKMQLDFEKWGMNISATYPLLAYPISLGYATFDSAMMGIVSQIYGILRVGFDFRI